MGNQIIIEKLQKQNAELMERLIKVETILGKMKFKKLDRCDEYGGGDFVECEFRLFVNVEKEKDQRILDFLENFYS
jgi:hypothetical protein